MVCRDFTTLYLITTKEDNGTCVIWREVPVIIYYTMKSLFEHITEAEGLRPVVIYGGKFQPFHRGHAEIYQKLCKEFGQQNVFIFTRDLDKSKLRQKAYRENHIFTFDEKVEIMTKLFHIPEKQIVKCTGTPYLPSWKEIPVEGSNYALITIAGEKDIDRFKRMSNNEMKFEAYKPGKKLQSCLTHKYYYHVANEKAFLSATTVRNYFREQHDLDDQKEFFIEAFGKFNKQIFDMVTKRINYMFESRINESVVNIFEGGVCGHVQHLYNDLGVTFDDLNEIIDLGFSSNLESSVEKVDGQPLAMTYRDGKFLFAYGEEPKSIDELELEFYKDLPKKVYREMCERLENAFSGNPNLDKWFSGNKLLHMDILSSAMPNMIKYNRDAIVFHYMVTYDDSGKPIDKDRDVVDDIARQLDNNNQRIEIVGPPRLKMKDIDFTEVKKKLHGQLEKMYKSVKLNSESSIFEYMVKKILYFCVDNGAMVDTKQSETITRKWLGLNKTHQFTERLYKDEDTRQVLIKLDAKAGPEYANKVYNEIKIFITSICIEILKGLQTYVAKDIPDGAATMKKILNDAIADLKTTGELNSVDRLRYALDRINALGGEENLFPSEGIMFNFKGKIYKITGMFADYIALSNVIRDKIKNNEYTI